MHAYLGALAILLQCALILQPLVVIATDCNDIPGCYLNLCDQSCPENTKEYEELGLDCDCWPFNTFCDKQRCCCPDNLFECCNSDFRTERFGTYGIQYNFNVKDPPDRSTFTSSTEDCPNGGAGSLLADFTGENRYSDCICDNPLNMNNPEHRGVCDEDAGFSGAELIEQLSISTYRQVTEGTSVALSKDNYLAVGQPRRNQEGSVRLYSLNSDSVPLVETIMNPTYGIDFGRSVALSGNGFLAIAAPMDKPLEGSSTTKGSVYLYSLALGGAVTLVEKVFANDDDGFGTSVVLSADGYLAVGSHAPYPDYIGSVYLYFLDPTTGDPTLVDKVTAYDGARWDLFGTSVALSGNGHLAVGSSQDDDQGDKSGSVYVYSLHRTEGATLMQKIIGGEADLRFGDSIALSRDGYLAVGVKRENFGKGSVYLYSLNDNTKEWTLVQKILPKAAAGRTGYFGSAVALSDDGNLVVGAPSIGTWLADRSAKLFNTGAVYLYRISADGVILVRNITAHDFRADDRFGDQGQVAISNGILAVGATNSADQSLDGKVYIYSTPAPVPISTTSPTADVTGAPTPVPTGPVTTGAPTTPAPTTGPVTTSAPTTPAPTGSSPAMTQVEETTPFTPTPTPKSVATHLTTAFNPLLLLTTMVVALY
eukprot:CAMPEP_0118939344 /NCGR_PEP_ID=MMETSP1169-20130426/28617_1 /TAXON_ID=36882 /ORGANISM="Pyramimonas obovata, Strain CCMP722" /LENGTH=650 /DNA_ID=CAMNT_0006883593 /DNA_START=25 /DNA_END=1977 /DNA_ORIENTATION=-